MDLIWKVGARAKEMLGQKDDAKKELSESELTNSTAAASETANESLQSPAKADEEQRQNDDNVELCSDKSSTPEYDENDSPDKGNKDAERSRVAGLAAGDIKDVSLKAVESAKSIGSFLYGVANRTGRSITETAKHLKQTVEQNSILGDFNKEQEAFVNNKASKSNESGLPPWVGCEDEENVKQQILSLSVDKRNFLRNPPSGVLFEFDFDGMYPVAMVMLKEDPALEKMRFELVPKLVSEENFWRNYFYRVSLLKQSSRLSTMAQQKSSSGDSSTWSSKKSVSDESNKDLKPQSKLEHCDADVSEIHNPEFVSDDYQSNPVSAEDIKHGMKMLGVTEKSSKGDDEWEKELQQELQEYEVVAGENADDDPAWENEIDQMLGSEKVKDIV